MKVSLNSAGGPGPRRASTATCFLVVLLGPLGASGDARAGPRVWLERDAGQAGYAGRAPTASAIVPRGPARMLRIPRATAVMGIRG